MHSYKTECPQCGKDNLYVTPSNGVKYCFTPGCGYYVQDETAVNKRSYVRSPMLQEIREYYTRMTDYYHSCLTVEALSFLYSRGFTDATIQELKLGFVPSGGGFYNTPVSMEAGLATYNKTAFLAGRVVFPYFMDDKTVCDIRGRSLSIEDELRYKSPWHDVFYRGADCPYGWNKVHDTSDVFLTEGEIKAAIGYQETGKTFIALPGINNWRRCIKQKETQKYTIIFDNQQKGFYELRRAITNAANRLLNPYVATLPLFGDKKQDIDTFVYKHGVDMLNLVLDAALPYEEWITLQQY